MFMVASPVPEHKQSVTYLVQKADFRRDRPFQLVVFEEEDDIGTVGFDTITTRRLLVAVN